MLFKKIKKCILSYKVLYEFYFFVSGKKINRKKLDAKIEKLFNRGYNSKNTVDGLIISLTSYGERLYDLKYTLFSLLQQSISPEKIVLWLTYGESIPDELRQFEKLGIEIRFYEKNIKSFTKLIPSVIDFPDKFIVTADDDIFYRKNWLKKLWDCHLKNPDKKIAHIAHRILFDNKKKLLPYVDWKHNVRNTKNGKVLFPAGVGGVLYPPSTYSTDLLDDNLFMKLCPHADDVWFYFMGVLSKQDTIIVNKPYNHLKYVDIYKEYGLNDKTTLQAINVEHNLNDIQIRNVLDYFELSDESFYNLINI